MSSYPILAASVPPASEAPSLTESSCAGNSLGLGPFSPVEFSDGRTQLFDRRGHGCGLFVNKQMAEQTARKVAALAR
jgi:hypothetical protein